MYLLNFTNTTSNNSNTTLESLIGICVGLPIIMIMMILCVIYMERNRKNCT